VKTDFINKWNKVIMEAIRLELHKLL
jgi:hypothetical protein